MDNKKPVGLIDSLKLKLIEVGVDYVKKNVENSKKELVNYVEKQIELKIKKEIKRSLIKISSYFILIIGGLFLINGFFSLIIQVLKLPSFMTSIFFGLLLLFIGFIIWLN